MKQRPVAIGMLTCEQIIVEEKTRNVTPVNCFTKREFDSFPAEANPFVVVAFLTDGVGTMDLAIIVQSLDNMEEIHRAEMQAAFADPLREYRCEFRLRSFSFPAPGHYQVCLFADRELLAQRKFIVKEKST
jgi:hypothetical protein